MPSISRTLSFETDAIVIIPTQGLLQTAQRFSLRHPSASQRIYRNTLAVGVVAQYLNMLGIKTDVTQGDSWHPVLQLVNDVADLHLPDYGQLECRVVEVGATSCYVPADVSCDRIAYIVVRLNLETAQPDATLLGFTPRVTSEWISIQTLDSLANLPQYLTDCLP